MIHLIVSFLVAYVASFGFAGHALLAPTPAQPTIALTFDDGPHKDHTEKVLDVLHEYNIPATFFLVGSSVEKLPVIARRITREGHEIQNHTWSHKRLDLIHPSRVRYEIEHSEEIITTITGELPTLFRPPHGLGGERAQQITGRTPIWWTIDPFDWRPNHSPETIARHIAEKAHDKGILLLHDTNARTVAALPMIIEELKDKGYRFVTASEMMEEREEMGAGSYEL